MSSEEAAPKRNQVLTLDPKDKLVFQGPLSYGTSCKLRLANPADEEICFKVKTTTPERYCVRPKAGILLPDESLTIEIRLRSLDFDPAGDKRQKFKIVSAKAPRDVDDIYKWLDEADPSCLMESKLKCVFVTSEAEAEAEGTRPTEGTGKPSLNLSAKMEEKTALRETDLTPLAYKKSDSGKSRRALNLVLVAVAIAVGAVFVTRTIM